MPDAANAVAAADCAQSLAESLQDILLGLTATQKTIAPKFLYDERGSRLFDAISALPEYYQTRTEIELLRTHGTAIADLVGPGASVIELGAGSSVKARLLLGCLAEPKSYEPVDVSARYLTQQAHEVAAAFPSVRVRPICGDFTHPAELPRPSDPEQALVFFPGSTIGNLSRAEAAQLLQSLAQRFRGGSLLIGVDVCRDPAILQPAYNDSLGVTAAFNRNLLARLNRELEADFDVEAFEHDAVYDSLHDRIEMRLVSQREQVVTVGGVAILFRKGEYIVTEHSHKYSAEQFARIAADAGWQLAERWLDRETRFSIQYFRAS